MQPEPFEPYPHQLAAIDFLLRRPAEQNGKPHRLLAHAPGGGKTYDIAAAAKRIDARTGLVICPAAEPIKGSWQWHLLNEQVCDPDMIGIVRSGADTRAASKPFVIVNYEMLLNQEIAKTVYWGKYDFVAIDEAHRLKSLTSKISNLVLAGGNNSLIARAYWKWLISGSIVPNRLIELFPALKTLCPELIKPYDTLERFGQYFCNGYQDGYGGWNFKGAAHVDELRERLKTFMHYLSLEDIYQELPDTIEKSVYVDIGDLPDGMDETNTATTTLQRMIGIQKAPYVAEYVEYLLPDVPKVIIFTHFQDTSEYLGRYKFPTESRLVYGDTTDKQRAKAYRDFINDPAVGVLVLQMQAAGTGIDGFQQVCNTVVFAEPNWADGGFNQCVGRIRRIGATLPMQVVKVLANNVDLDIVVDHTRRAKKRVIDKLLVRSTPITVQNTVQQEIIMSLEDVAKELTAAVKELTAALKSANVNPAPAVEAPPEKKPAAGKKGAAAAGASTQAAPAKTAATTGGTTEKAAPLPSLEDLRKAALDTIQELMNRGHSPEDARNAVAEVRQEFGYEKLDTVTAEDRGALIEAIGGLLAGESDPLGSL